jgi:hypothetical protein
MIELAGDNSTNINRGISFTNYINGSGSGTGYGIYMSRVSAGAGNGYGIYQQFLSTSTGNGYGLYIDKVLTSSGNGYGIYQNFVCETGSGTSAGLYQGTIASASSGNHYGWYVGQLSFSSTALGKYFSLNNTQSGSSLNARTSDASECLYSRESTATSGTLADDFNLFYFKRTSIQNGAGGTFTAAGSILNLENVATQTSGTLTDSVIPLQITQDADSTGVPINITQNAVVSTNFKKIITESGTGCTIWVSDGSTSPNGSLSGQAGDICLNGDSGNIYRCTGTTNWTAM